MTRPVYVETGIIPSNCNQKVCQWSSLYFQKSCSVGILWTSLYISFRCYYEYTKVEEKRAHPCCECSKIRKACPQHMLCAVVNKLLYPGLGLCIFVNKRETLLCCRNTFPNNLIVEVNVKIDFRKNRPKKIVEDNNTIITRLIIINLSFFIGMRTNKTFELKIKGTFQTWSSS